MRKSHGKQKKMKLDGMNKFKNINNHIKYKQVIIPLKIEKEKLRLVEQFKLSSHILFYKK